MGFLGIGGGWGLVVVAALVALGTGRQEGTAQGRPARAETAGSFGSVTGHVYLAGSHAPARFVQIALQPAKIDMARETGNGKQPAPGFTIYQTGLDGSYAITHVAAGSYYLVTMQRGFFSPFSLFTREQLEHPDTEVQQRMASVLPLVTVRANAAASLDVTLERGASLSGTVRFDDGIPFSAATVVADQRAPDGKWVPLRIVDSSTETDPEGRWSLGGLPAGTYRVSVQLRVDKRQRSSLLSDNANFMYTGSYLVPIWLGDTARERDAKTVTLEANQAAEGEDITVPVTRIHQVTGALLDERTGLALNAGTVRLVNADDGKEVVSAQVDAETRTFTLPFVPEGEYRLRCENGREVRYEPQGDAAAEPGAEPFYVIHRETLVRPYAAGEMPIVVAGDTTGVNLPLKVEAMKPH